MFYKFMIVFYLFSCILFSSCNDTEENVINNATVIKEEVFINDSLLIKQDLYQKHALNFGGFSYVFLDQSLYKIDSMYGCTKLLDCIDAVGTIADNFLYFAILDDENMLYIIGIDENGYTYKLGTIENVMSKVDFLDISYDHLFIQYETGDVSSYAFYTNGLLDTSGSDLMFCYSTEHKSITFKDETVYGVHMFPVCFTLDQYYCEFIATNVSSSTDNKKQLLCEEFGEISYLFEFYGNLLIKEDSIIYIEDSDFTKIMRYNIDSAISDILITFVDGNFLPIVIEDNYLYGNWYSKENNEFYISKINLDSFVFTTVKKIEKNQSFVILDHTLYQIGENDTLVFDKI